ncbi:MAG: NAD+ synthase [Candidatus Palauibacterales bacterium]|nr:NAD+ synthase [Candidatus Palauibacterales bacterium]
MHVEIAVAQFRPVKGDPAASLDRLEASFAKLLDADPTPNVVVYPETALTGYFLEGGVREHAIPAMRLANELARRYGRAGGAGRPLDVVVGFYEVWGHRLYNAAMYVELGAGEPRIVHVHRKVFLPTYGVFQEERFVEAGHAVRAFDTRWGRAAMLICEDLFHSISATLAALDGAQILLVPSASPARGAEPGSGIPANLTRWHRLAQGAAEEHGVGVAVSQLVGFEGGKGFAGGSVVFGPRGQLLAAGPLWDEALIGAGLDLEELTAARTDQPLLADLERALPRLLQSRHLAPDEDGFAPDRADTATGVNDRNEWVGRPPRAGRSDARDPGLLEIDPALVTDWLVRFLQDEMLVRRGFERAVVGLSGGVDSALTAALCARALGPENVTGFLLPYRTSSPESSAHAELVADALGIRTRTVDISDAVDGYLVRHEPEADPTRRGNVMARMRMIVLFDQSAKLGALPIGTGNKSERLLGYFTWHADDSPPINPLGDLFKTQVWSLARHLGLPPEVVDKPATADLIHGQTDESDLGVSYTEADLMLHHLLNGRSPEWLKEAGFEPAKVEIVFRRLEGTHWKRNLPTVAMLSGTAIGEWYLRPVDY